MSHETNFASYEESSSSPVHGLLLLIWYHFMYCYNQKHQTL